MITLQSESDKHTHEIQTFYGYLPTPSSFGLSDLFSEFDVSFEDAFVCSAEEGVGTEGSEPFGAGPFSNCA